MHRRPLPTLLLSPSFALGLLFPIVVGCSPPKATMTSVRLQGTGPKSALVVVDEQVIGSLAEVQARGFAVLPGKHFITVKAPGYLPFDYVLETSDRPKEVLSVQLEKWPDD